MTDLIERLRTMSFDRCRQTPADVVADCQVAAELIEVYQIDAARYRWLRGRDLGPTNFTPPGVFIGQIPENLILSEADADAAIDAAMAAERSDR